MRVRAAVVLVLATFGPVLPAQADMIEIRGKGVLNGKVLSQDDKEVRFEDSAKNVFVAPRGDVLFLELQKDAPLPAAAETKAGPGKWKPDMQDWGSKARNYYDAAKDFVMAKTKGIRDFISAPLDRSAADAKAKDAADTLANLRSSLSNMNNQNRKRMVQMRGIHDDEQVRKKGKGKSKQLSGGFASLD